MDDATPHATSGGADDETKRHNNLRRDILTSLIEVDQSIKGLEHNLVGRIQQIEEGLHAPAAQPGSATGTSRCEFDPAATTAWALRLLQDNLAPFSSEIIALKEALLSLRQNAPRAESLVPVTSDLATLKESIQGLRDELERIRSAVSGLQEVFTPQRDVSASMLELTNTISRTVCSIQEGVEGIQLAPLRDQMHQIQDSVSPLRDLSAASAESTGAIAGTLTSLRKQMEGIDLTPLREEVQRIRDAVSGLKEAVPPLRDATAAAAESSALTAQTLSALREETRSLPGSLRSLRDEMETALRKQNEEHSALLREIGGKVLEEISLMSAELRKSATAAPDAAAKLARHLELLSSGQQETLQTLGRVRELLEQSSSAEMTLAAVQEIQQQNEAARASLAEIQDSARRTDAALQLVRDSNQEVMQAFETYHQAAREETERIRQRSAQEQNNRGVLLYYRGAPEAAEQAFRKALDSDPAYAEAWNNLGLAMSRQGKEEDAAAAFQKAIELDPKMGEVYNNLGFLYHTTLKYDRALEMFNQAIQTTSDSAIAYTNLGNTFYKMNRHEQAVQAWKRALELDPLNENARRCLRMYQQENA